MEDTGSVMPEPRASAALERLPSELTTALSRPDAFPDDASARETLECVQTHISHVFLTGSRVYKFRKAVRPGFLDFGTRSARNADCLREIALNRRLAPDVYLGVAPLLGEGDALHVGAVAEELGAPEREHCVVMRRLPSDRDALTLLGAGAFGAPESDALAEVLAEFHAHHALGSAGSAEAWLAGVREPIEANLGPLRAGELRESADELAERTARALDACAADIARRYREGRAVDGHGDLHLQHVWLERPQARPLFVDWG